jgi:hypothetical protein
MIDFDLVLSQSQKSQTSVFLAIFLMCFSEFKQLSNEDLEINFLSGNFLKRSIFESSRYRTGTPSVSPLFLKILLEDTLEFFFI